MKDSHWLKDNPYERVYGTTGYYVHDRATRYAMRIVQKEVPAPDKIIKTCERHLDDVDKSRLPGSNIFWDYSELQRFEKFCLEHCVIPDHINNEIIHLRLLDPFALAFGLALGWKMNNPNADPSIDPLRRKHLSRRYRTLFLETPKGSGKTPVAAAYILYHMAGLNPPPSDAKVAQTAPSVFVATDLEKQAKVIKTYLFDMIDQPSFNPQGFDIVYRNQELFCENTKANCIFKSARGRGHGTAGFIPSLLVVEEAQEHESLDLYESIAMGFKNRPEPLTIFTLNAGRRHASAFWVERAKAERIATLERDPKNDNYLPMIWGVDARDEPLEDESCWRKVYPTLGTTINKDYIVERVQFAQSGNRRKAEVLRLNFGVWTGGMSDDWIDLSVIEECFVDERPQGVNWKEVPMVIGLDLSRSSSLTGFAKLFLLPDGTVWVEADGYTCRAGFNAIMDKSNDLPLKEWIDAENGIQWADTPRGESIDYDPIAARLFELSKDHNLIAVGIDSFGKDFFYKTLSEHTDNFIPDSDTRPVLGGMRFFDHKNGKNRGPEIELPGGKKIQLYIHDTLTMLEERISKGTINFLRNPVMAWNFGCVVVQRSGESMVMMKKDAEEVMGGRIDVVAAIIYGFGVLEKAVVQANKHKTQTQEYISYEYQKQLFDTILGAQS